MAPSAADLRLGPLAPLADLLEPRPGRVEFALRLALICALTGLVAEIYQTPSPALTIYVAFFLNRSDRASSLLMNVAMVLVISIVIGLVFLVAQLVIDDPMWRVSAMAAISVAFLFLGSASKLRPVGATLALIVAYALDLLGNIPVGEAATRALLYAWLFVGIPASVSIVVNLLCATPPKRLAERLLAWRLRLAAGKLTGGDERSDRAFREALREGVQPIERLLHLAKMEHASPVRELAALRQAAGSTFALMSAIDVMDRVPVTDVTVDLRRRIAGALDEMASEFDAGALPAGMVWEGVAPEAGLDPLTAELLVEIRSILEAFARPTEERAPSVPAEPKSGFFEADAFTNPDHVRYALKTTAAAMSCYVLYSLLDWPGIHTCFITCYIV
ncbi:MAG: FUSC family protein, partial [Alphaproteobacteria bacterium]|nr:FUSC family protein [Alphaproteobacteria bacterium]